MPSASTLLLVALALIAAEDTAAAAERWSIVLRPADFVAGEALPKLKTRRRWAWQFENGKFEVAVRRSSIPVPSPKCGMDYLILTMPLYYPENPAQAPMAERRAVYDALLKLQSAGQGGLKVQFDALWYARKGPKGTELTSCNIYFTLPLAPDAARIVP